MLRRLPALVLLVGAVLAAAGCSSRVVQPTPAAVDYAHLAPAQMHVVRVRFCDLVAARAVSAAVAGVPASSSRWDNGAPIPGVAGADIGHELGCTWTGPTGAVARAWVFARPVTATFAGSVVAAAAHEPGCTGHPNTVFGHPAVTQVCQAPAHVVRVRQAGLFGDTWLSCEVQARASSAALTRRSNDWCAAVASALDTAP